VERVSQLTAADAELGRHRERADTSARVREDDVGEIQPAGGDPEPSSASGLSRVDNAVSYSTRASFLAARQRFVASSTINWSGFGYPFG